MCCEGKPSCECVEKSSQLMGSESGNPKRAESGAHTLCSQTAFLFWQKLPQPRENICPGLISKGLLVYHPPGQAGFRFPYAEALLGAGRTTAENGGREKPLLCRGRPSLCLGKRGSSPHGELPCKVGARCPPSRSQDQQIYCGQAAGSGPG